MLGCIALSHAQGLTVTAIAVNGQPAQSVAGVQVRLPGATSGQPQTLRAGQTIASGTELTLPRGARVELTSSNGNKITLHPGARFLAGVVTAKGESHQPLGGRVDFQVRKALDFFNIQYDRITASVKGTDFSVDIDPAKSLKLTVTEGVVEVERQVQIRFAEAPSSDTPESDRTTSPQGSGIRIAEDLKAAESRTYRLDVEEYLTEFKNFGEAEAYFTSIRGQTTFHVYSGTDHVLFRLTKRGSFDNPERRVLPVPATPTTPSDVSSLWKAGFAPLLI